MYACMYVVEVRELKLNPAVLWGYSVFCTQGQLMEETYLVPRIKLLLAG